MIMEGCVDESEKNWKILQMEQDTIDLKWY